MAKKAKSKIKISILDVRPKVVNVFTGSIYSCVERSIEEITNPVVLNKNTVPKVYKKGRSVK